MIRKKQESRKDRDEHRSHEISPRGWKVEGQLPWDTGQLFLGLVVVQLFSHVPLFATPWTAAHQASLSFTISWSLLRLMSIESVMPSNHLILVVPFSSCLQSFPASGAFPMSQLFTSGGQSIRTSALASVFVVNLQC